MVFEVSHFGMPCQRETDTAITSELAIPIFHDDEQPREPWKKTRNNANSTLKRSWKVTEYLHRVSRIERVALSSFFT